MSVPAVTNEVGSFSFYRSLESSRRTWGSPFGDSETNWSDSEFYHWCSRSGNATGNQIGGGARAATSFSRAVCSISDGQRTDTAEFYDPRDNVTIGGVSEVRPLGVPLGDISAQSYGRLESMFLKSDEDGINQAITQAMNNLGDQKVNLSQAVVEGRRTYSMLASNSSTLWNLFLAAKRRQWSKLAEMLGPGNKPWRKASDNWLQLQYGWKPLLSDLYGSFEWFTDVDPSSMLVSGSSRNTRTHQIRGDTVYGGSWAGSASCTSYAKIVAKIDGSYARAANKGGLVNPVGLAWELLPYSFVIDWFVPIGNVLQAYSDSAGLTFFYGYSGSSNQANVKYQHDVSIDTGVSRISESGSAEVKYFSHHRNAYGGFPRPGVYGVQDPFSTSKGISALALYEQARRYK